MISAATTLAMTMPAITPVSIPGLAVVPGGEVPVVPGGEVPVGGETACVCVRT